jgi:hypothetical protein
LLSNFTGDSGCNHLTADGIEKAGLLLKARAEIEVLDNFKTKLKR